MSHWQGGIPCDIAQWYYEQLHENASEGITPGYSQALLPILQKTLNPNPFRLAPETIQGLLKIAPQDLPFLLKGFQRYYFFGPTFCLGDCFLSPQEQGIYTKYQQLLHNEPEVRPVYLFLLAESALAKIAFQALFAPVKSQFNQVMLALATCIRSGPQNYRYALDKPQRHSLEKLGVYEHYPVIEHVYMRYPSLMQCLEQPIVA